MQNDIYNTLRKKAVALASASITPSFYRTFSREISESAQQLQSNTLLRQCIKHIGLSQEGMGHGYEHSRAVAVDAGVLVKIEGKSQKIPPDITAKLINAAHISGLLHDIKRGSENHAVAGSRKAAQVVDCFCLERNFKEYIILAIRNHEAFRDSTPAGDLYGKIVSDALYDADKFQWGPDNFTKTIWSMLEYDKVSPVEFHENFSKGMDYIARIKETFRTEAGRRYGPEIIENGLEIGRALYSELGERLV